MFTRNSRLTGEIAYYYSGDPAWDKELRRTDVDPPPDASADWQPPPVFDYQRWVETGNEACLPRKTGALPVKIVCKRLTPDEWALVEDKAQRIGQSTGFLWLFRLAVQRIEPKPPDTPEVTRVVRDGFKLLADDWTELLHDHDGGALYYELVARLYQELNPSSRS